MGAAYHRGSSKQDYRTPGEFLLAVAYRFGCLDFDLAANRDNAVTTNWFGPGSCYTEDTLKVESANLLLGGMNVTNFWLNPPYDNIGPWADWCHCQVPKMRPYQRILFLVPASVGSNWYRDYVHPYARVIFLNGRLSFDGKNPFPKDCMLCEYGPLALDPPNWRHQVWDWKKSL